MEAMKAFVITIEGHDLSNQAAERCIESGARHGVEVIKWRATTPDDNPVSLFRAKGLNPNGFGESYSRTINCMAAFLSHLSLWRHAADTDEDVFILEHDAVFVNRIPNINTRNSVISMGKPSYGKFNTPDTMFNPVKLMSKAYFPGAHAYVVSKDAAPVIVEAAKERAAPTDLFFSNKNFDFLYEYYPWPVEAMDSFTTIQNRTGCIAKHNYGEEYKIV